MRWRPTILRRCVFRLWRAATSPRPIATAHSPLITKDKIEDAFALTRDLPNVTPPPQPDQNVLDAVLGAMQPA